MYIFVNGGGGHTAIEERRICAPDTELSVYPCKAKWNWSLVRDADSSFRAVHRGVMQRWNPFLELVLHSSIQV